MNHDNELKVGAVLFQTGVIAFILSCIYQILDYSYLFDFGSMTLGDLYGWIMNRMPMLSLILAAVGLCFLIHAFFWNPGRDS